MMLCCREFCREKSASDCIFCNVFRSLEFQQGLLLERQDWVLSIEGVILDVNQIMRELAALVYEQGDTISKFQRTFVFSSETFRRVLRVHTTSLYL